MTDRYMQRRIFKNSHEDYKEILKSKNTKWIKQYNTPVLKYPSPEQIASLNSGTEIWKTGDRLYKYAFKYYSDPELWWVIAWFNKKPTEADFSVGDVVYIPQPLEKALTLLGVL